MLSKFELYKLTFGPTPIEKLFRLTAQIFAKREDWSSCLRRQQDAQARIYRA
jgi:1-aminocyclopropane-1-carboxylate deaminase/D-cysteine desulfhydrase-like pyridoxal-dependent ACC family enzyme